DAGLDQPCDLVAHQRDQRRYHDAAAFSQQRRQLIAQRLSARARHKHPAAAAFHDMPHDLFLRAAKGGQAEDRMKEGKRVHGSVVFWIMEELKNLASWRS